MNPADEISPQTIREEIAREIVKVHDEAYGSSSRDTSIHVADDIVLIIIDAMPTSSERTLIDAGRADAVLATREAFQDAIAATFIAIVERATGRRVMTFFSRMSIEPFSSVELFRLQPENAPSG